MFNLGYKSAFKSTTTIEKRKEESAKIRAKYPDRVPIICEKLTNSTDIPTVDKKNILFQVI